MKRALPPLDLNWNPLVLVLGQVKISPVLKMADYIPPIQEKLRLTGFPGFRAIEQEEISFVPKPSTRSSTRWAFTNREATASVVIAPNFIVYQVTEYAKFEDFIDSFSKILKIVGEETRVALSERLGLRYVNLIQPASGEPFSNYLQSGLLGLAADKIGAGKVHYVFEERGTTEYGDLIIRLFENENGGILPPDLESFDMKFALRRDKNLPGAILDVDHFSAIQRDFVVDTLLDGFYKLHDYTDRAFRAAVSEEALKKWAKK